MEARYLSIAIACTLTGAAVARDFPTFPLRQRIDPPGVPFPTMFGESCAVEGDLAAVGAFDTGVGTTLYSRSGGDWTPLASLMPTPPAAGTRFGSSVAIANGRVFVGAPYDSSRVLEGGSVRVFESVGGVWTETARLDPAVAVERAHFGTSLAAQAGRICVGAPGVAPRAGAVHAFDWSGVSWIESAVLAASDPQGGDEFGRALSLVSDRLLVGAPKHDGAFADSGAAYVLESSGGAWAEIAKLERLAFDPAVGGFGSDVELFDLGLQAAVSEWTPAAAGALHVWRQVGGSWSREARIVSPEPDPTDAFGFSLAVQHDGAGLRRIFAGAPAHDDGAQNAGAVFVFQSTASGWHAYGRLAPGTPTFQGQYGVALALAGDQIIANAPGAYSWTPQGWVYSGCAYVHDVVEDPFVGGGFCFGDGSAGACGCGNLVPPGTQSGCANADGTGATLAAFGTASIAIGDFEPLATGLPPGKPAALIGSRVCVDPAVVFADGLRCVGAPRVRYATRFADDAGFATWPTVFAGNYGWKPGETWFLQAWYRNTGASACGNGTNLSNALEVAFTP